MTISAIVPVFQAAGTLAECLAALAASTRPPDETVVIDDGSTDDSAALAVAAGARVLRIDDGPAGPARARNAGAAAAAGDILLFLDADVVVHRDAIEKIAACFQAHPDVDAIFGSYDAMPRDRSVVSQYRNLLHHYVHQHGRREATTFWAGCGAVRRQAFTATGGFDAGYTRPSIEDIELGARLRDQGRRIWLLPDVQVTHLKAWTYADVIRTDIRDRALPWTRLIVRRRHLPRDLNLSARGRAGAVAAWAFVAAAATAAIDPPAAWVALAALVALVSINAPLYAFFARARGWPFALAAAALHTAYLLYSSAAFVIGAATAPRAGARIDRAPTT